MDVKESLKNRLVADPIAVFSKELLKVFTEKSAHRLLNPQTAEIGLILLGALPGAEKKENRWSPIAAVASGDERYQQLFERIPAAGWNGKELNDLLIFFFGAAKAPVVRHAWERMRFEMYQTGYDRRSFRAPENPELYFCNQINFLIGAIPQVYANSGYPDYERQYYDLSFAEQIKYSHFFGQNQLFRLWSAALDLGDETVFAQLEDIIFNRDETGKITREAIKALLNSEQERAWQLVEKLLLAAQRQEGLRQTVLEALDETSKGALKYMINVIVSNKLTRFSSVVRAVDVWAGLGWESERENTVKTFLEKARHYLENPNDIATAVESANNSDVYMALWAQGVEDVEQCFPFLQKLYQRGNQEKRGLALKFAIETKDHKSSAPLVYQALEDADLLVLAWALHGVSDLLGERAAEYRNHSEFPRLFDKLRSIIEKVDHREKTFEGKIFAWTRISFNRNQAFSAMIDLIGEDQARLDVLLGYFDQMSVELREKLTRHVLRDYAVYAWNPNESKPKPTRLQHDFAVRLLSDKGEFMARSAFQALHDAVFSEPEMRQLQTLLKRKGANFRGQIINLLLKQSDEKLGETAAQLLAASDAEQRLAGLDILLQLKKTNRLQTETKRLTTQFASRKNVSPKEEILLSQLVEDAENAKDYSVANGFGFFERAKSVSPVVAPQVKAASLYETRRAANAFGFSVSIDQIKRALAKLAELYLQHKDFEYKVETYNNASETVLLGNTFRNKKYNHNFETAAEQYAHFPLPEVWRQWFAESGLQAADLFLISLATDLSDARDAVRTLVAQFVPSYKELMPKEFVKQTHYYNPLISVVDALRLIYPFNEKDEFMLGAAMRLFASIGDDVLKSVTPQTRYYSTGGGRGWQFNSDLNLLYHGVNVFEIADEFIEDLWNLAHWRQFSGGDEAIDQSFPPLMLFCRAFELKIIGEDELLRGLMTPENVQILSLKTLRKNEFDYFSRFEFLKPLFERVREHILNVELKRGDSATPVTTLAASLRTIYGVNRFIEILTGLGKTGLNRGYSYYYGGDVNKQSQFSRLLKNCFPLETDSQTEFDRLVKRAKITETKLVEAAVYAAQWQKFVSRNLNWKGLDSAVWWMHAHTKISGYREQTAESESEIARYSQIDLQDFKDGAVDKDWFERAVREIGKARWETVYDAAKYISDGNGHRRARLYADVISGKTKLKEITQKVKTKRDQDYLRMYGLAPLGKNNREKDVLNRYLYLQQFKKESKQFGAQKQTSEALAIRIALENLARNAGFADPQRLTWAMETKQVQEILANETVVQIGDQTVKLEIDQNGQADVIASKNGKLLANIPAKLKKEPKIIELIEQKKTLKDQFARARQSLEEAMTRGDLFAPDEIENLFAHPVISKLLEKLVFATDAAHGFYRSGKLVSHDNSEIGLTEADEIRIAHVFDLHKFGAWSDYQRFCFDKELKQPFKQIFRELYLPTADELQEKSVSRRYAGHQIQPKQTVALLKTRGWKIDYEEGLQKVFHKQGFAAKMYALADWFSPAEVESPTLETVVFTSLKDRKNIEFENIDARIFSETMRDIDLVVSVAHAGGVDPEASHSTIEMRAALLRETARLFRLDNVVIAGSHAKIAGALGEYTVHLGSAVTHQSPGKYLSVLPVHAQQRGRIFLPFADDDPKSAEVVSKVLLLARDNEIQDPTILRQLI